MLMGISFFKEVKPMPLVAEEVTAAIGVPYRQKDIGVSNKRPNQKRKIKYIVIHPNSLLYPITITILFNI